MNVGNTQQSELLKLINSNDDLTLNKLGLQAMEESGFINQQEQAYGYYAIAIGSDHDYTPNLKPFGFINAFTLFIPALIGFPTDF